MSALHYGRIEAVATESGRVVYTADFAERPVPGWAEPCTSAAVVFIPRQRCSTDNTRTPQTGGTR